MRKTKMIQSPLTLPTADRLGPPSTAGQPKGLGLIRARASLIAVGGRAVLVSAEAAGTGGGVHISCAFVDRLLHCLMRRQPTRASRKGAFTKRADNGAARKDFASLLCFFSRLLIILPKLTIWDGV